MSAPTITAHAKHTTPIHTYFEGYWCELPYNSLSSLPYKTYPESQHPTRTFSFPKPNHFDMFWSLPQNRDFIPTLNEILIRADKRKPPPHSLSHHESKCRLCHKEFGDIFEYVYRSHSTIYYIASTIIHYYRDHKIQPSRHIVELVRTKVDTSDFNDLNDNNEANDPNEANDTSDNIDDDWIKVERPYTPLSLPLPLPLPLPI